MQKITTSAKANAIREKAKNLYEKTGPSAVYELGKELGLDFSRCAPCNASTPSLQTPMVSECLLCGESK